MEFIILTNFTANCKLIKTSTVKYMFTSILLKLHVVEYNINYAIGTVQVVKLSVNLLCRASNLSNTPRFQI